MTNIKTFPSWIVTELKQTCEFNDPKTWDVCVLIYLNKEYPVLYFSQVFIHQASFMKQMCYLSCLCLLQVGVNFRSQWEALTLKAFVKINVAEKTSEYYKHLLEIYLLIGSYIVIFLQESIFMHVPCLLP